MPQAQPHVIDLLNPKYYTETFNMLAPCFFGDYRFNVIWGGSNSSKSYSAYQRFIQAFNTEREHDYLVVRKFGTSIYDSVFQGMKNIISDFHLEFMYKYIESPGKLAIVNKVTGRRIIFKGLDDTEKIKSIVNIKYCLIEEATELTQSDFNELDRRLRGFEGIKFFLIFNPVSRTHWINNYFFLTEVNRKYTYTVHCNVDQNRFATPEDIERLDNLLAIDENDYRIYRLGEWGVLSSRIILKNWTIIDEIPEGAKRIPSGMDFGFSPDPTVKIDHYLYDNCLIVDEAIYETGLLNINTGNDIGNTIEQRLIDTQHPKDVIIIADSAEEKSIREIRSKGYSIYAVKKPGIMDSLKVMKSYRILVTRKSKNVINEYENYLLKIDRNGVILPEPIDEYNHSVDCTRYVLAMKSRLW